jgi:hypothetical protein
LDPEEWTGFGNVERNGDYNPVWSTLEKLVYWMTKERNQEEHHPKLIL